jgi:hypothetical protein
MGSLPTHSAITMVTTITMAKTSIRLRITITKLETQYMSVLNFRMINLIILARLGLLNLLLYHGIPLLNLPRMTLHRLLISLWTHISRTCGMQTIITATLLPKKAF